MKIIRMKVNLFNLSVLKSKDIKKNKQQSSFNAGNTAISAYAKR